MTTTRSLALSAFFVVSGACFAQTSPEEPSKHTGTTGQGQAMTKDPMWDDLDANRDGVLTKDELKGSQALVTHFDKIDSDHDGKISQAEWKAYGHNK